jgi:hypothetical protein
VKPPATRPPPSLSWWRGLAKVSQTNSVTRERAGWEEEDDEPKADDGDIQAEGERPTEITFSKLTVRCAVVRLVSTSLRADGRWDRLLIFVQGRPSPLISKHAYVFWGIVTQICTHLSPGTRPPRRLFPLPALAKYLTHPQAPRWSSLNMANDLYVQETEGTHEKRRVPKLPCSNHTYTTGAARLLFFAEQYTSNNTRERGGERNV